MLRFRGALYREAGANDLAKMALGYLWRWIYRAGLTKRQVLDWFARLLRCDVRGAGLYTAGIVPTELRDAIARLMAQQQWNCGDFLEAITEELEKPMPGFRWQADKYGQHILVKVRSEIGERAIVQGKRFADSIFLGCWWTTDNPRDPANQAFQRFIRKQGGSVFWNKPRQGGGRQYGAFLIVDRSSADTTANQLCDLSAEIEPARGEHGHRLSAISMVGIAEHRDVRESDQVWAGCIRSTKFNWKHSLPDLLNGRIDEFRSSKAYKKLQQELRER